MNSLRALKHAVLAAVPAAVLLLLTGFFAWQATTGQLGLRAYAARQKDLAAVQAALDAARADQLVWRNRVQGLDEQHLDQDALDEKARQMLDLSKPEDIVVPAAPP